MLDDSKPLFRRTVIQKDHYSEGSLFRIYHQGYYPKNRYSEGSLSEDCYSKGSLFHILNLQLMSQFRTTVFRIVVIPKGHYFLGLFRRPLFRKTIILNLPLGALGALFHFFTCVEALRFMFVCKIFIGNSFVWRNNHRNGDLCQSEIYNTLLQTLLRDKIMIANHCIFSSSSFSSFYSHFQSDFLSFILINFIKHDGHLTFYAMRRSWAELYKHIQ